jgi:putative endonuclease
MKFIVYILESLKDGKHYIGQTSNLDRRLKEHNQGRVRWTKSRCPLKVIHIEKYALRTEAIKREHFLKSPQGWKEYRNIKDEGRGFPEGITS